AADFAQDWVVEIAGRCNRALSRGVITVEEAVAKLFDEFAGDRRAPVHLAQQVWMLIPEIARPEFVKRVEEALKPGFRRQPFLYGGARPATEEELRRDADEQTARIQAWSKQFRRVLAGVAHAAEPGATADRPRD